MTLDEAREHIGHGVVYSGGPAAEDGTITSVGSRYVFVRYAGDASSKATRAEDLELLALPEASASCVHPRSGSCPYLCLCACTTCCERAVAAVRMVTRG